MGSARILIWKMAIKAICSHPVIGIGFGSFYWSIRDAAPYELAEYFVKHNQYPDKAHNEFFEIAVDTGIPGLIIYLLFVFSILEINLKDIFKNKLSLIFALSIIGYLVQSFFNIRTIFVGPIFFFVLGLSINTTFKENIEKEL